MQDFENDSEMKHVRGMDGGMCRVMHSMDLSINLANSSHYDVNNASQGFTIWTEDHPSTTEDWYFVLPNMKGNSQERIRITRELPSNCLMVPLLDGMAA
jgi:hypothetical protein